MHVELFLNRLRRLGLLQGGRIRHTAGLRSGAALLVHLGKKLLVLLFEACKTPQNFVQRPCVGRVWRPLRLARRAYGNHERQPERTGLSQNGEVRGAREAPLKVSAKGYVHREAAPIFGVPARASKAL